MSLRRHQTFNLATHSHACSLYFLVQPASRYISSTILITTTTTQLLWHVHFMVHQTSLLFRLRILWTKKEIKGCVWPGKKNVGVLHRRLRLSHRPTKPHRPLVCILFKFLCPLGLNYCRRGGGGGNCLSLYMSLGKRVIYYQVHTSKFQATHQWFEVVWWSCPRSVGSGHQRFSVGVSLKVTASLLVITCTVRRINGHNNRWWKIQFLYCRWSAYTTRPTAGTKKTSPWMVVAVEGR